MKSCIVAPFCSRLTNTASPGPWTPLQKLLASSAISCGSNLSRSLLVEKKKRQWQFWHIYWRWQHCNVLSIQDGGMTMLNKGSVVLRIPIHLMYFITLTHDEHRNDICDARSELLLSLHGWYVFLNKCFLDSFCPRDILSTYIGIYRKRYSA